MTYNIFDVLSLAVLTCMLTLYPAAIYMEGFWRANKAMLFTFAAGGVVLSVIYGLLLIFMLH